MRAQWTSVATIITEFFVMLSALFIIPKSVFEGANTSVSLKAIGAGAVMIIGMWGMSGASVVWYLEAPLGIGLYGGVLLLLKTFNSQELDFMRKFFVDTQSPQHAYIE